jgi:two-component system response regulator DevR
MTDSVTVFLVDDHEVVRQGLRTLLEESGLNVVGEASTAAEAVPRIVATQPRVAVLDVQLPDGTGIDVCREIRSRLPETVCLMLTSFDDDEALFAAIMAGAAGYLLKQIRGLQLVEAVQRVARGESLLDPKVTTRVLERLRSGPKQDPRLASLTDQERRILDLIAEGLTNRQIGSRLGLAEKTVKNYVSSLLAKIGMRSRTQAALYVAGAKPPQ